MLRKSTLVFLLLTIGAFALACDLDQMRSGCRIANAKCSCGYGCKSDFRYDSNEACKMALRGKRHDICTNQVPCLHDGTCLQISQEPGFKCRCEGTGFYGPRCERPCPRADRLRGPFPYECVVI